MRVDDVAVINGEMYITRELDNLIFVCVCVCKL